MESQEKKYIGRGGWRGGGCLKKAESEKTVYKTMSIAKSPEEIEEIRKLAKKQNKTVSRFIIESVLK